MRESHGMGFFTGSISWPLVDFSLDSESLFRVFDRY
jgi:hypothetical protein